MIDEVVFERVVFLPVAEHAIEDSLEELISCVAAHEVARKCVENQWILRILENEQRRLPYVLRDWFYQQHRRINPEAAMLIQQDGPQDVREVGIEDVACLPLLQDG